MKYYSTQRPITPGSFPKPENNPVLELQNFENSTYCQEIDGEAWGWIEYKNPLSESETGQWELTPEGVLWIPVTIGSRKRGGGLRAMSGKPVRAKQRPEDTENSSRTMQMRTRYFRTSEVERILKTIRNLNIKTERVRPSATQGFVSVYINGTYILDFGDDIVLTDSGTDQNDYYGDNIGGYRSCIPDSNFTLGLIWNPLDFAYHYSDMICRKLGIQPKEWIEGN